MRWKRKEDPLDKLLASEEFAQAAMQAMNACLSRLPELEECEHEFSPQFEAKMECLFVKIKRRAVFRSVCRYATAILLAFLIAGGGVLTVDAIARNGIVRWKKSVYENYIFYEYVSGPHRKELPHYQLGWVPEGYEVVQEGRDETSYYAIYQKGDDLKDGFIFEYYFMYSVPYMRLNVDEERYEYESTHINGMTADLYICLDGQDSNCLIWVDEELGILFLIDTYFHKTDMLHMAKEAFLCEMMK